jgi:hypothetical protein
MRVDSPASVGTNGDGRQRPIPITPGITPFLYRVFESEIYLDEIHPEIHPDQILFFNAEANVEQVHFRTGPDGCVVEKDPGKRMVRAGDAGLRELSQTGKGRAV